MITYNIERQQRNPDLYSITPANGGNDQSNLYVLASDYETKKSELLREIERLRALVREWTERAAALSGEAD